MPEFVEALLDRARGSQTLVGRHLVELLAQPRQGDHGDMASELSLPIDETQHGDKKVLLGNGQQSRRVGRAQTDQLPHDGHGAVLLPSRIESVARLGQLRTPENRERENLVHSPRDEVEHFFINPADGNQAETTHTCCPASGVAGSATLFSSPSGRLTRNVVPCPTLL